MRILRYIRSMKFLVLGIPLCLGCFHNHPTPLVACAETDATSAYGGTLRILPSQLPSVTIDSTRWESVTESMDLSTESQVRYYAYLSTTVTLPLSSFAVQFRSNRSSS
jgi:hypothetical protein